MTIPSICLAQPKPRSIKTWPEIKSGIKDYFPKRIEEAKKKIKRARIVRMPKTTLTSYDANPALYIAITTFYDFIKGRELDVYEEQEGIPNFFPDRNAYYDFLDTILPPMRDRKFERNRILSYEVHEIKPDPEDQNKVEVVFSVTSDDTFPFGKTMLFSQQWVYGSRGWYPGKVSAEPATYWERIR